MTAWWKHVRLWLGLAAALAYPCVPAKQLDDIKQLGNGEIAVVGRIELAPPLEADEQTLKTIGSKRYRGMVSVFIGDKLLDLDDIRLGFGKYADNVKLGEEFFIVRARQNPLIYSGGLILTSSDRGGPEYWRLPGGLKLNYRESDKAIYIGTIRYHRDEFNGIKKVEILAEYDAVKKKFAGRFGNAVPLRYSRPLVIK